tara:strand:+ start:154 stop:375 length:222 start_codon:yes stop_codon:yes gene_type:complete
MRNPILEPIVEENSNSSSEAAFQVYNENYVKKKLSEISIISGTALTYKGCILFFIFIFIIITIILLDHYKIIH